MHYDFMGKKYLWFAISGAVILIGLISLLLPLVRGQGIGLNWSIDFESGNRLVTSFSQDTTVDGVRNVISNAGYSDAVVQTIGGQRYQITLPVISLEEEAAIVSALDSSFGVTEKSWKSVGPTFGKQVRDSMFLAVFFASILIIAYVWVRFEFKSAIATFAALVHDLLITAGVYSVTGREVTTATVAAVLTILGYSLYDTIIVFDRIRENTPKARRGAYAEMVNQSIWEVMARSIITTLLTLMPVICLFIFGGETLKDFAFALIIGITSGAYSSIFVAAPILTLWKEREKQFRPNVKGKASTKAGGKAAKAS